jgi:hypothetical protein
MPNAKQYKKVNKREAQEYNRLWRIANRVKLLNYYRQYRINNLERVKKLQRDWYVKNKSGNHQPVIEYKKVIVYFD